MTETPTTEPRRDLHEARPDWNGKCWSCGASPTVSLYRKGTDVLVSALDLCGPCCFGSARASDPDTWSTPR